MEIISKFGSSGINYANISATQMYEILTTEKGLRPDPSSYLPSDYIEAHLKQFDDGAVYFLSKDDYLKYYKDVEYISRADGTMFVMPENLFNDIIAKADGDVSYIEKALGYKPGSLPNGDYVAIRINNPSNYDICIPSGNEIGANNYWIPGGYTSGDVPEAIVKYVPNDSSCISLDDFYLEVK